MDRIKDDKDLILWFFGYMMNKMEEELMFMGATAIGWSVLNVKDVWLQIAACCCAVHVVANSQWDLVNVFAGLRKIYKNLTTSLKRSYQQCSLTFSEELSG